MAGSEQAEGGGPWLLRRQDDNGNRYEMARFETRAQAQAAAARFEARGHKQLYFVERAPGP
jgi:8-oxo-dGTP diphosphatase